MAIRQRLVDDEYNRLAEEVDDLTAAYIETMRKDGVDEFMINLFIENAKREKAERAANKAEDDRSAEKEYLTQFEGASDDSAPSTEK